MSTQIFRSAAMARPSSPEQLNQPVRITSAREWLALLALVLLIAGAVFWGFAGRLPTKTQAGGVLLRAGKPLPLTAPSDGQLTQLAIKLGDHINAGDFIAVLAQPRPSRPLAPSSPALQRLMTLRDNSLATQEILSPYSGQVVAIHTSIGHRLKSGTPILSVLPDDIKELELAVFVTAMQFQELKPGMAVEITPSSIRADQYGFLRGTVRAIADSPASDAELIAELPNSAMSQFIMGERPVYRVRVQLIRDRSTASGYQWSTKAGNRLKITPAMPCAARIIVRQDRPITLVVPALQRWAQDF